MIYNMYKRITSWWVLTVYGGLQCVGMVWRPKRGPFSQFFQKILAFLLHTPVLCRHAFFNFYRNQTKKSASCDR